MGLLCVLALALPLFAQLFAQPKIGVVEIYGAGKVSRERIQKALGARPGDPLPKSKGDVEEQLEAVEGLVQARLEAFCCEGGGPVLLLYPVTPLAVLEASETAIREGGLAGAGPRTAVEAAHALTAQFSGNCNHRRAVRRKRILQAARGDHSTLREAAGSRRTIRSVAIQTAAAAVMASTNAALTQIQSPVGLAPAMRCRRT